MRLGEKEEVTCEAATTALRKAVRLNRAIQASDGHWAAENAGPMFFTPPLIIILHISGAINTILTAEHKMELLRYIYLHQNDDGGWGFYIGGHSIMFGSVLSYIALRLLGEGLDDGEDGAMTKARKWILDNGDQTKAWRKGVQQVKRYGLSGEAMTSAKNEASASRSNSIHVQNAAKMWRYCRETYMPMSYLYGRKYHGPITDLVKSLRQEIHTKPYEEIDWNKARHDCCKSLQMMCWWAENPDGDEFKHHLARVPDYLWLAEDGMKMQSFGSQIWDTTLATQAIIASNMPDEYGDSLRKAHFYIKESQIKENPTGDFTSMYRHFTKGGWTFSDRDHGWAVSDCTAESLKCLLILSQMPLEIVGEKANIERLYDAVNVLLYLQVQHTYHI
ncbi:hypothetical protein HYC85_003357 [Camellia sinensis]|uniref:Squalene cyclase N-terminal domain-containing protein n=1 Tax=Camellia sinensis TaxID=4442 RepID=A0A7J7ID86_CAMSI|nr:hypothetical protein HYC85_003357 [Camellia sinensis]